jgi:hypothetical protein
VTPKYKFHVKSTYCIFTNNGHRHGLQNHLVYVVVVNQSQLYMDLTGKFPVRSSKGDSYVIVSYVYDCNYVKVIAMKSRSASEWVKAYDTIHQELTVKGFKP